MLVLLPPSESKAAPPRRGRPLDPQRLSFPELTDLRKQVLAALIEVSARPDALARLGAGTSLAAEVARNVELERLPSAPAHVVYAGVLFEALGWSTLTDGGRRRGASRILVASALWGWTRPNDRIPPYRLSMDADLPGLGPLARLWRPVAVPALVAAAGRRGLIVDCRSAPYAAAAPVPPDLARRTVAIRVLREQAGRRTVVSHLAKHTRGEVTRHLLERPTPTTPTTPAGLAAVVSKRWPAELLPPPRPGQPWTLDVILA